MFIPADGQPMEGYEQAKAMIEARGGDVRPRAHRPAACFAWLFGGARGGGADDDEEGGGEVAMGRGGIRAGRSNLQVASAAPDPIAAARGNVPRGPTFLQAPETVSAGIVDVRAGGARAAAPAPAETARVAPPAPAAPPPPAAPAPPVAPTAQLVAAVVETDRAPTRMEALRKARSPPSSPPRCRRVNRPT